MSRTAEVSDLALSLKENGHKIVNMATGELSFKPALSKRKEACRTINKGETLYTQVAGLNKLRNVISAKLKKDLKIEYNCDEIIVSNGGKQVIYKALQGTINRGDEVIIISPYWVSYPEIIKLCGGRPKVLNTTRREGFSINTEKLEKLITSKTKWIILNSPNNPTGVVYSPETIKKLVLVLRKYPDIWILSAEIYEKLNFSTERNLSILHIDEKLNSRSLVVN